jgi:hypothetical protein
MFSLAEIVVSKIQLQHVIAIVRLALEMYKNLKNKMVLVGDQIKYMLSICWKYILNKK